MVHRRKKPLSRTGRGGGGGSKGSTLGGSRLKIRESYFKSRTPPLSAKTRSSRVLSGADSLERKSSRKIALTGKTLPEERFSTRKSTMRGKEETPV